MTQRRALLAALPMLAAPRLAGAQRGFPDRPVRFVVPYAGGGGLDATARALARALGPALGSGATVIVDNKPGGGTRVGTTEVAQSRPDGHTLLFYPAVAWIGYFYSSTFDRKMWREMTPVVQFASTPYNSIITKAGSGLESWARVVEKARRTPGGITAGGPAAGGFLEYSFNENCRLSGITGTYVPYRGGAEAFTALLAGQIDYYILTLAEAVGRVRTGAAQLLAVSSPERHPLAPEVPTYVELGIGDTLENTFSLWGPPEVPEPLVERLAEAVRQATADPAFVAVAVGQQGYTLGLRPAGTLRPALDAVDATWGPRLAGRG